MKNSEAGPDNRDSKSLRDLDESYLLTILNLQLFLRQQIKALKQNRTILIPKTTDGLKDASNWRPITLSVIKEYPL